MKLVVATLALGLLISLAAAPGDALAQELACGTGATTPGPQVGLILPGSPVQDPGFNGLGLRGVLLVKQNLGGDCSFIENVSSAQAADLLSQFAEQGADIVYAQGGEYQSITAEVAAEFPDTVFINNNFTNPDLPLPANMAVTFIVGEESWCLAGVLSATLSQSGKGLSVEVDLPSITKPAEAFEFCAQQINPSFELRRVTLPFPEGFNDVAGATEATLAAIADGVDVFLPNADQAGTAVINTVARQNNPNLLVVATNGDLSELAPDNVIINLLTNAEIAFLAVAQQVVAGTFQGGYTTLGLANGGTELKYNPATESRVSNALKATLADYQQQIISCSLAIPRLLPCVPASTVASGPGY
ncbi:MAG: BMP family protein [Deinococcus sp.]|nr:BMP family protein [Deinococcus sp.]